MLKGGRVQPGRLPGARIVAAIVKRYAIRAGLDPAAYAGHRPAGGHDHLSRTARRLGVQDPGG